MAESIKLPIDNTPIHELVKYLNEMKLALKEVSDSSAIAEINADIEKTNQLIKEQIDNYDTTGKSVQDLRKDFKALKDQLSEATDPDEIAKLAKVTGTVRDKMKDLNEQVAVFATGSKFESMSTSLGQIKGDLMSMDFEGASEKAQVLTKMVNGISFKEATGGLKQLGTTFMNLGKALLTNPLFLLATIIVGIVLALKELMDAIGVTKAIMKIFGDVMKVVGDILNTFIIEPLKAVADWLGITSNAADEAADREVAAAERKKAAYQDAHNSVINNLENEIKVRKAAGEDTSKLEAKLLNEKRDAVKDEIEQNRRALKAKEGKLLNSKQLDDDEKKELEKSIKELRDKIKADKLSYNNAIGDIRAFYAAKKKERADDKAEDKKKADDDAKEAEDQRKAAAKAARDAAAERKAIKKQLERDIIDIGLSYLEEGQAKEEALVREAFKRKIEDTTLKGEQKARLVAALQEQEEFQLEQIKNKYAQKEADKAKADAEKIYKIKHEEALKELQIKNELIGNIETLENAYYDSLLSDQDRQKNAIRDKYFTIIEEAKKAGMDTVILEKALNAELEKVDDEFRKKKKDKDDADAKAKIDKMFKDIMAVEQMGADLISAFTSLKTDSLDKEKKDLEDRHARELAGLEEGTAAYTEAKKRQAKEDDILAKKAFEANKKMQLGTAIMNAAMGITSIIAQYPKFDGGIAMAAALIATAATNAAAIAKIASTKYESNNTGSVSTNGVTTSSTPSINLFGNPNNANTVNASTNQPVNVNNQVTVKAYVSETDITDSQKRIARYQNSATL